MRFSLTIWHQRLCTSLYLLYRSVDPKWGFEKYGKGLIRIIYGPLETDSHCEFTQALGFI